MAPHIVRPMRFVLPHHRGLRPALLIRLGLLLYDHLGGGRGVLEPSGPVELAKVAAGRALKPIFTRAFEYSDCWVDDARLVVLNAMDAASRGAEIRVRTEVVAVARLDDHWQLELRNRISGQHETVTARTLVNATGAWAAQGPAQGLSSGGRPRIRLVKGSHIVVRRLFEHASAYIFQNADRRIIFAIPYEQDYTLIGTTDVDFVGDLGCVVISKEEAQYLCRAVSEYFVRPVDPADIVWSYAGVRSLHDDGELSAQDASRDFVLDLQAGRSEPPVLTIIGGKITTYRHVAEEVLRKMAPWLPSARGPWTRGVPLPGGNFTVGLERLARELSIAVPALATATAERLVRSYGTLARQIFAGCSDAASLGRHFGGGLYEREVAHLVDREWAMTAHDVLWRRTKLGLGFDEGGRRQLADWLSTRRPSLQHPADCAHL
jgi:glycerol-3-phosphate dehydrogenase